MTHNTVSIYILKSDCHGVWPGAWLGMDEQVVKPQSRDCR